MPPRLSRRGLEVPLSAASGSGVFICYASLFNQRDQSGDIVMPGAFYASLLRRPAEDIRMLFQHDPAEPWAHGWKYAKPTKGFSCAAASTKMCNAAVSFCHCWKAAALMGFRSVSKP